MTKHKCKHLWWTKNFAICFYVTRDSNAFNCIKEWSCYSDKYTFSKQIYIGNNEAGDYRIAENLAANMIGVKKRVIIINMGFVDVVMFNPVLVKKESPYETKVETWRLDRTDLSAWAGSL